MNNIIVIVVIYNSRVLESPVVAVMEKEFSNTNLVIVDNSNQSEFYHENRSHCKKNGIHYLGDNNNYGLSKAYNMAISYLIGSKIHFDFIALFDQDTIIPESYFKKLFRIIEKYSPSDPVLFYPIVQTQIHGSLSVMSPRKIFYFKDVKEFYINSGITFSKKIIERCKYNENLFLDFIDYEFLLQVRNYFGRELEEIPTNIMIIQDFSGGKLLSFENDFTRFQIFSKDLREFGKIWPSYKLVIYYILIKRCLHLSKHYHTRSFFNACFYS